MVSVSLNIIKEKVPVGVTWHVLSALSHLATHKEKYAAAFNETSFSDKMSDFHEFYAQINPNGKHSSRSITNYRHGRQGLLGASREAAGARPVHDHATASQASQCRRRSCESSQARQ